MLICAVCGKTIVDGNRLSTRYGGCGNCDIKIVAKAIKQKERERKNQSCSDCCCYYLNCKEGGEVRIAMDEAQIECSNECPHVRTNNESRTCNCWQKFDRRRR